jgi:hypothetical protein
MEIWKMKKYFLYAIFLIYFFLPYLLRQDLILENIKYFMVTGHSEDNIERALFYFDDGIQIEYKEIIDRFMYTDSVVILGKNEYDNRFGSNYISFKSPLFSSKISQYSIYARVKNTTLAGGETLLCIADYIWFPWGWVNIDNYIQGGA